MSKALQGYSFEKKMDFIQNGVWKKKAGRSL